MAEHKDAKHKDVYGREYDDKDTIPAGIPTFPGKVYTCAYCHALIKGYDNLPTCPKCGYDKYLKY